MLNKKIISLVSMAAIGSTIIGCGSLSGSALNNTKPNSANNVLLANNSSNAAVINGNGSLVLKTSPDLNSKTTSYLSVGEMLKIQSESGTFYKVTVEETGATGYIAKDNAQIITSGVNQDFVKDSFNSSIVNVTTNVHLRDNPSMNSAIISNLSNGNSVKILGKQGDWYKVTYGNSTGYIYKLYISKSANTNINNNINAPTNNSTNVNTNANTNTNTPSKNTNTDSSTTNNKVEQNKVEQNKKPSLEDEAIPINEKATISVRAGLYKEINNNSSLITTIEPNTQIMVLEREGNVYKIKLDNGTIGYVNEQTVKFPTYHGHAHVAIVGNSNGQPIDVYSKPDTSSQVLGKLDANEELSTIKNDNNWYKINFNGKIGYIQKNYVTFR